MRKLYLSGAITGLSMDIVKKTFNHYESILIKYGEVVNPLKLAMELELKEVGNLDNFPSLKRERYLANSILALLDCNEIWFIPGWGDSEGCQLEWQISGLKKIDINYLG